MRASGPFSRMHKKRGMRQTVSDEAETHGEIVRVPPTPILSPSAGIACGGSVIPESRVSISVARLTLSIPALLRGTPEESLRARARGRGVRQRYRRAMSYEDDLIRYWWPRYAVERLAPRGIAERLGWRDWRSVAMRAFRLGLTQRRPR